MTKLLYVLRTKNLYGSERMALDTAAGLSGTYDPIVVSPPGAVAVEAARLGLGQRSFRSLPELVALIHDMARQERALRVLSTSGQIALIVRAVCAHRTRVGQAVVVHGGITDARCFGTKKYVWTVGAELIAVSRFVATKLQHYGVHAPRIRVIENFLAQHRAAAIPRRSAFREDGVRRVAVVARLSPEKRLDLLLDALAAEPRLKGVHVDVYGDGPERESLVRRARAARLDVTFAGFVEDATARIAEADLLVHPRDDEPFGLVVLEAMTAGVPVLVADAGGAADLIQDGVSGVSFRARDSASLAARLVDLTTAKAARLNSIVEGADRALATRFRPEPRLTDYADTLERAAA